MTVSTRFSWLDAVDRMCQSSKFEPLDLSDYTVITSSIQLTESTIQSTESSRFRAKRLETTSFSLTLYIPHYLWLFKTREQPYLVWKSLFSLPSLLWAYIFLISSKSLKLEPLFSICQACLDSLRLESYIYCQNES